MIPSICEALSKMNILKGYSPGPILSCVATLNVIFYIKG